MTYITLRSAFHNPDIDAESLYQQRFAAASTVHINLSIADNQAFCFMDDELYSLMLGIARSDKTILALSQQLPGQAIQQFLERTLVDEIVLTNGIEGVNSSRKEIGDVLRSLEGQNKRKRFFGLVSKYNMLIKGEEIALNTPEEIRSLYDDLVFDEVKSDNPMNVPDGRLFRKGFASVYNSAGIEIHQGVFPEARIEEYLSVSLDLLNDSNIDLLIRTAISHYLIGYIHPFYDGNGRLNRFLSSALLLREYEPLVGLRLSYAITQSVDRYYQAFSTCNDPLNRGDLTPFVLMFLEVVLRAAEDIVGELSAKKELLDTNLRYLQQIPEFAQNSDLFDLAAVLLQARMFTGTGISLHELMSVFDLSRPTVMKRLKLIESLGLLEKEKSGREAHHQINIDELAKRGG
jgi:Fic family protein